MSGHGEHESHAGITAEIRARAGVWMDDKLKQYDERLADRLDAALKRERGDCAKLREAIEDLFAKGCVSRHDRVAVCPPCIDNEGYSPSNEWCARCSSDVKEKCMAIYNARAALAVTEKEGGAK